MAGGRSKINKRSGGDSIKNRKPIYIVAASLIALCIVALMLTPLLGQDDASSHIDISREKALEATDRIDIADSDRELLNAAKLYNEDPSNPDPATLDGLLPEGAVFGGTGRYSDTIAAEYTCNGDKVLLTLSGDGSITKTIVITNEGGTSTAYETIDNSEYCMYNK